MSSSAVGSTPGPASPAVSRLLALLQHYTAALWYPGDVPQDKVGLVISRFGGCSIYCGRRHGMASRLVWPSQDLELFLEQEGFTGTDPGWMGLQIHGRRSLGRLMWRPEQQAYYGIIAEGCVVRVDLQRFQKDYPFELPPDHAAFRPDTWLHRLITTHEANASGIALLPFHAEDFGKVMTATAGPTVPISQSPAADR